MEFKFSNVEREMEVYGYDAVVKSHCRMCHGGCGVLVYVKDGKVARIAGDPRCPINHGTLCSKGLASAELAYHSDRLTFPVKRVGPKGSGNWDRISWDEALDTIADRILTYKEKFGAESIVLGYGTGRENEAAIYRFANLLGSPNVLTAGHFCYGPRISTSIITCGTNPIADYENLPKCIMMWGNNLVISNPDCYKGESFSVALDAGAKLIVVDPRPTRAAARADIWLQLRPGTDAALALGVANVIVNERLYDKEFVENHCYGWDLWVQRVNEYPPGKVEKITWVPEEKIRAAARLFATTKPAVIQWGVAIEQQINCTDNNRILLHLMGITGNIDAPGGQVLFRTPPIHNVGNFGAHAFLPPEQRAKRLGRERFRLANRFAIINPKCVWDAILEEKPYPVKMLFFISTNPVKTRANAKEVYRALRKVDFMAVADFFLTPTANLADIVLPAATWLEMDYIGDFWKRHGYLLPRRKVIQVGECRSDHDMLNALAHRVGQGQYWWDTFEGGLDYILKPTGMTWQDFKKMDFIRGKVEYYKYKNSGFSTPTKRFELYCTSLEKMKYDPLPRYREIPESPVSTPELHKEYPYILITGARQPGFFHTENRQVPWLRELHRDPQVEIHPETANKESIKEGSWVIIESPRGKVRQRAKLTAGIDPRVVAAQHGWWFPEKKNPDHGWAESNINILTDNAYEGCDPAMGATNIRVLLCKIYPDKDEDVLPWGHTGKSALPDDPTRLLQGFGGTSAGEQDPVRQGRSAAGEVSGDSHASLHSQNPACMQECVSARRQDLSKYALTVDPQYCWGCKTCEVACKQENRTADGVKLIDVTEYAPTAADGKLDFVYEVNLCRHCDDPPCATACPVGAITKRTDGIVILDEEVCTGCRSCTGACPYEAIAYDDEKEKAQKCNMCHHRIDRGLLPACADNVCLAHCIYFGEADQAEKMAREKSWLKYRLAGRLGEVVIKVGNKSS